jgi:large subunit ribosomal protein L25
VLELVGGDESPGVSEGGVLEQVTRELTIEALPTAIPDVIEHDVSAMELNETITLEVVRAPAGVTLLDDPETTVATLSVPKVVEEPEIEEETELIGEDGEPIEAVEGEEGAEGEAAGEGEAGGEGDGDGSDDSGEE